MTIDINDHLGLLHMLCLRFAQKFNVRDHYELLGPGFIAMARAAENYDEKSGNAWSTYASIVVNRDLHRAWCNDTGTRRVVRSGKQTYERLPSYSVAGEDDDGSGWDPTDGSTSQLDALERVERCGEIREWADELRNASRCPGTDEFVSAMYDGSKERDEFTPPSNALLPHIKAMVRLNLLSPPPGSEVIK